MIQKLCAYMPCKNYAHRFLFISYTKNIYINCMHTLYENKNYVHKLFTNIYEKKLQSKNIKHRKSNKERKKEKACPNPRSGYRGHCIMLLLLYSNTAWAGCSAFVFTWRKEMEKLK